MFNEIDGNFDDVAIKTFKVDLPGEHGLRKSLIVTIITGLEGILLGNLGLQLLKW